MDFRKLYRQHPRTGYAWAIAKDRLGLTDPGAYRIGVDDNAMSAAFVITTSDPDRVGDIVRPQGISLTNFKRNPIGFFNHQQWPLPIGVWEDPQGNCTIMIEPTRAVGTIYFSQRSPEALQVFALVSEGILRATSIGFNPLEPPVRRGSDEPNPQSLEYGYEFGEIDLLEVSVVGVPAAPTATLLRGYLSSGRIAGEPIDEVLFKALSPFAEPEHAWSPGAQFFEVLTCPKSTARRSRKKSPLLNQSQLKLYPSRTAPKAATP